MTWAPYEYQKRVFEILNAHPTLAGKVFDRVPDATPFPHVQLSDESEWADRGSHTTEGWTATFVVHIWSRAFGRKETMDLMALIDGLLHNVDLAAVGWKDLSFRREFGTILIDDDNVTFHGVIRYKLLTGEKENE